MLIKVQTHQHSESYLLIDRVDSVSYKSSPVEFMSSDELVEHLHRSGNTEGCRVILDPRMAGNVYPYLPSPDAKPEDYIGVLSEKRVYRVNTIEYERDGQRLSVTFDTIAYICNDEGKTLEKACAGGPLNY
ncbi:hypothetical protein TA3x_000393 [Tundrisphaera sp. TA3]|uniref:hypothetical protein n=1 Tax=Tundrisphaera sp. TA3 TaxID=3435775 RepID=UPI003EB9F4E6